MTTTTSPSLPRTLDAADVPPVPLRRLVAVERRKLVDTRAGRWLLVGTFGLLVVVMVVLLLLSATTSPTLSADLLAQVLVVPVSLLVPALAILTVTSEWGQRTHLVTFTLEPVRWRVVVAKLVVVAALGAATIVAAVAVGAATNALHGVISDSAAVWDLSAGRVGWTVAVQALWFLMAFGFGMLLLNTPAAVTVFYVVGLIVPAVVHPLLYALVDGADRVLPWVDLTAASMPYLTGTDVAGRAVELGGTTAAQLAVTTGAWVLLPLALGTWRVLRAEVR
ncbi:ABC transporter permease [Nitriliruptoraceae bacterium ZYF776]|nr:ABC transporter permease [Profundirhabdus halotolerans]